MEVNHFGFFSLHRGFAFVEFYNAGDAAEAHDKLDHAKLAGREIAIVFAKDKRKTPGEMRGGGRDMGPRGGKRIAQRAIC